MTGVSSTLENLAACAISYLTGIIFTLALIAYMNAAISKKSHHRQVHSEP